MEGQDGSGVSFGRGLHMGCEREIQVVGLGLEYTAHNNFVVRRV